MTKEKISPQLSFPIKDIPDLGWDMAQQSKQVPCEWEALGWILYVSKLQGSPPYPVVLGSRALRKCMDDTGINMTSEHL